MNDTVMVRLNKRRLIETFRFAYPNRYTVLAELLQNARRAGASAVHVRYDADAKRLTVTDDGCGVSDFQTLLTLGESGWSEAVRRTEQPFGLGFLQSLYVAERCCVESAGRRLRFDTRAALILEGGDEAAPFTIALFGDNHAAWTGAPLGTLTDARIRVRGPLGVFRDAPQLCLEHASQLEILAD